MRRAPTRYRGSIVIVTGAASGIGRAISAQLVAVGSLSTALRPEAARYGAAVSVLCPGAVDTPILDDPPAGTSPLRSSTLTGREYMATVGLRPISADRFARAALRGVVRNRAVVVSPASTRALWYLQRAASGIVDRVGRQTAGKVIRRVAEKPPWRR